MTSGIGRYQAKGGGGTVTRYTQGRGDTSTVEEGVPPTPTVVGLAGPTPVSEVAVAPYLARGVPTTTDGSTDRSGPRRVTDAPCRVLSSVLHTLCGHVHRRTWTEEPYTHTLMVHRLLYSVAYPQITPMVPSTTDTSGTHKHVSTDMY